MPPRWPPWQGIRREQYARCQPLFWRPAVGALDKHRAYLASLIGDDTVITRTPTASKRLPDDRLPRRVTRGSFSSVWRFPQLKLMARLPIK